jgi:hypothetical protein
MYVRQWAWAGVKWVVGPVVGVLVIRGMWGWVAGRQLAEARRELAAAGVGVRVEDYEGAAVPEERNAVVPVLHAIDNLRLTKGERALVTGADEPAGMLEADFSPTEVADIDRILNSLGGMFEDLDAAMARPEARWPREYLQKYLQWPTHAGFSRLADVRFLAHVLQMGARRAHERHDDGACLHHIRQILAMARVTDANPSMISHLMASALRATAAETVDEFLPELRLDAGDDRETRALLAELLADRAFQEAKIVAFQFDAVYGGIDLAGYYPQLDSWLLRPVADEVIASRLRVQLRYMPAVESSTYNGTVVQVVPRATSNLLASLTFVANDHYAVAYARCLFLDAESLADTRAVGVLLAARTYWAQQGRWAGSLAELRGLIGAGPADPFARDGSSLRYRVDAGGPTVWSVGEDGVDGGGIFAGGGGADEAAG